MSSSFVLPVSALVNDNNLHIDSGNPHTLNGDDDELDNELEVDIDYNIEAEPEIHETEVDDQNIGTPNEGNGESVAVPGPHQHIDIENQEVAEQRSVNNSDVEEGPTNGDLAARVKLGSKIGILAASTSLAGTIPIFSTSGNYHEKNLYDKLLLGGSLLFILASFVFGVTLVQGHPFFHLEIFPMNNPRSIRRIKLVTGAAIVSITMVMIFGLAIVIGRVY